MHSVLNTKILIVSTHLPYPTYTQFLASKLFSGIFWDSLMKAKSEHSKTIQEVVKLFQNSISTSHNFTSSIIPGCYQIFWNIPCFNEYLIVSQHFDSLICFWILLQLLLHAHCLQQVVQFLFCCFWDIFI